MKTKIKLTIIVALVAILLLQGVWTATMFNIHSEEYQQAIAQCLREATDKELSLRKQSVGTFHYTYRQDNDGATRDIAPVIQTEDTTVQLSYDRNDPYSLSKLEQSLLHQFEPLNIQALDSIFHQLLHGRKFAVNNTCVELIYLKNDSIISRSREISPKERMYGSDVLTIDAVQILGVKVYADVPFRAVFTRMWILLVAVVLLMIAAVAGIIHLSQTIYQQWKKDEEQRLWVNAMTHEFKGPIQAIGGALKILLDHPERLNKYAGIAALELNKLQAYIDMMLDISYGVAVAKVLVKEDIQLRPFFYELKKQYEHNPPEGKNVEIILALDGDPVLHTNKVHFSNIMDNLVKNAIKYSDESVRIQVTVTATPQDIVICVRDNGWGIAANELPHIFDSFFRGQQGKNCKKPGFGMGLSYVKAIMEAMGGTIRVNSKEGEFTEFVLEFPIPENDAEKANIQTKQVSQQHTEQATLNVEECQISL